MKLVAFRIQNFKSIIDSGWCNVSKDGVTCLIGQNESGKSSVLEALYSFGERSIEADFVRSDGTEPIVSCKFEVDEKIVRDIFSFVSNESCIDEIINLIKSQNWQIIKIISASDGDLDFNNIHYGNELEEKLILISDKFSLPSQASKTEVLNSSVEISIAASNKKDDKEEEEGEEEEDEEDEEDEEEDTVLPVATVKKELPKPCIDMDSFEDKFTEYEPVFVFFNDESNLLPNEMDIDDIVAGKNIDGRRAVLNLLKVGNIDIAKLKSNKSSSVKMYMNSVNKSITTRFQDFWTQQIGKGSKISVEIELKNRDISYKATAGKPYLEFWIKDDEHILHPKQRSKGVRWFLSFYLSLKADSLEDKVSKSIFLIDEPGANLHARAQEDVLKVFEDIRKSNQVLYSTHSQHLIEFKNLHRLLAVQRKDDSDESSETVVIPAYHLGSASTNTLAPILEHMGIDLSNQNVISRKDNIVLEEISAFYYMMAFETITSNTHYNYLPATGVSNIEQLVLLLTGWGIKFGVVFDDDSAGRKAFNSIKKNLYQDNDVEVKKNVFRIKNCDGIEDLFSQNDFYKILLKETSYTSSNKKNSDIAKELRISKPVIALDFYLSVKNGGITAATLEPTTLSQIQSLMSAINTLVTNQQ